MQKIIRLFILVIISCVSFMKTTAQQYPPFWNDIQEFKKRDSISQPASNQILFIGSSSFTYWQDVQNYFPGYPIINRGFGGSTLPDVLQYVNDIIFPYNPREIVIYCGENDLAASDTVTAQIVFTRFKTLFTTIRKQLPQVPIAYISIKPSPSRAHLMPRMDEANNLVKAYLKKQKKTAFIDVYHKMLDSNLTPIGSIFRDDSLHMNPSGYAIWQKEIEPYLVIRKK